MLRDPHMKGDEHALFYKDEIVVRALGKHIVMASIGRGIGAAHDYRNGSINMVQTYPKHVLRLSVAEPNKARSPIERLESKCIDGSETTYPGVLQKFGVLSAPRFNA